MIEKLLENIKIANCVLESSKVEILVALLVRMIVFALFFVLIIMPDNGDYYFFVMMFIFISTMNRVFWNKAMSIMKSISVSRKRMCLVSAFLNFLVHLVYSSVFILADRLLSFYITGSSIFELAFGRELFIEKVIYLGLLFYFVDLWHMMAELINEKLELLMQRKKETSKGVALILNPLVKIICAITSALLIYLMIAKMHFFVSLIIILIVSMLTPWFNYFVFSRKDIQAKCEY